MTTEQGRTEGGVVDVYIAYYYTGTDNGTALIGASWLIGDALNKIIQFSRDHDLPEFPWHSTWPMPRTGLWNLGPFYIERVKLTPDQDGAA